MLTSDGRSALGSVITGWLGTGARIFVGDGQQRAEVPLDFEPISMDDGTVELSATFGEEVANFEWREQGVVVEGKVVDMEKIDGGRKILGATWTVNYALELVVLEPGE